MPKIYIAEVTNIKGDDKAGYVQVRKYGYENDEKNIKDEHLQWAVPLQPVTSAATGKIGKSPHGLRKGSRVLISYAENDPAEKHPFILGSFARSAPPSPSSSAAETPSADDTTKSLAKQAALDKLNANPNATSVSVSVPLSDGSTYTSTMSR